MVKKVPLTYAQSHDVGSARYGNNSCQHNLLWSCDRHGCRSCVRLLADHLYLASANPPKQGVDSQFAWARFLRCRTNQAGAWLVRGAILAPCLLVSCGWCLVGCCHALLVLPRLLHWSQGYQLRFLKWPVFGWEWLHVRIGNKKTLTQLSRASIYSFFIGV